MSPRVVHAHYVDIQRTNQLVNPAVRELEPIEAPRDKRRIVCAFLRMTPNDVRGPVKTDSSQHTIIQTYSV